MRIIVPFGAGSTPDIVARLLAENLGQKYPASAFVVENKPGAGGNTGTDAVAKADPDGATIGVSIGAPLAINTILFSKLPYDPKKDIAAITQLVTIPSVLAVSKDLGVNSVAELVALLKREPGKYNFASIGNGSLSHLSMEAIVQKAGSKMVHVPYPSSPAAMTALLRNDVQMTVLGRDFGHAACRIRQCENPRGVGAEALGVPARRPDAEGARRRCGSRYLAGADRARRHPRRDHRQDQQGRGRRRSRRRRSARSSPRN